MLFPELYNFQKQRNYYNITTNALVHIFIHALADALVKRHLPLLQSEENLKELFPSNAFNPLSASVALIQKPVNWFAQQLDLRATLTLNALIPYTGSKKILNDYFFRDGSRTAATSKVELFVTIVIDWKPLTIITVRAPP